MALMDTFQSQRGNKLDVSFICCTKFPWLATVSTVETPKIGNQKNRNGKTEDQKMALVEIGISAESTPHLSNSSTIIGLGLHTLSKVNKDVQIFKVLKWRKHHYNALTNDNDVQLVQLSGKAKLSNVVKPLELPTTFSDVEPGTICESAGWGRTRNEPGSDSDKLLEVSLPVISRQKCAAMWKPRAQVITKNMMCTLDAAEGKDTCNGDSGGPLICQGQLRGVVSFGPKYCGNPVEPAVYAFLNEDNVNWIKRGMENK
ncbi:glandular kallikrein-3, submandibular-like [Hyperolius riggenbachi]|uniref:glandular kallikrein-3, submandibular-like n=1 Tax=Hyperolius riggenbachi TaxID=752182 RepID=UPI0035A2EEAF